ncbi:IclR family transcriptional regulator [Salinadaptatus halalkaliphilus]|uniref:IclR family transcriptional regulator n=1 Tax=Salinadaptatus halalkaliphilus TaxID=2419781 RepID=A0A4S3TP73_9EURY|nr:IclR family transcriptional regulator [Salinadaptatus halalkaliphilus]THE66124.1 IclR family transcriptional regulator [Salinadaptatus halalkaliphilus]
MTPPDDTKPSPLIQATANSLTIIGALVEIGGSGGVTEISQATDISTSSVHKHLRTLQEYDFVEKDGQTYSLGLQFLDIGGFVRSKYPGSREIKLHMQELAQRTDKNAFFTVEENGRAVVLYREVGRNGVPMRSRVGTRFYMNQAAGGLAILAEYSTDRIDEIIDRHGLPPATPETITDRDQLLTELERTRERGYAMTVGETTEGVQSIAVPVTQPENKIIGACAVSGPIHRMGDPDEDLLQLLRSMTNELELSITYS